MQIKVTHSAFQKQQLAIIDAGLFRGPRLLLNGEAVAGRKGSYTVTNDAGDQVVIRLRRIFPDPAPRVTMDGVAVELARPLAWYQYLWSYMPAVLLFSGGAFGLVGNLLGGLVGVAATYLNLRIFRGHEVTILKYWASLLVTLGSFIVFALLITLFQATTGKL